MTFYEWRTKYKISTNFIAHSFGVSEITVMNWGSGKPIPKDLGILFKRIFNTDPKTFKRVK